MEKKMPSLEEQDAVVWYVLRRPIVRPNTSYRKAILCIGLFVAINVMVTILLYYLFEWFGIISFLPSTIQLIYTEHRKIFIVLLTLLQFIFGGIIALKSALIGAIRLYQRYAPENI